MKTPSEDVGVPPVSRLDSNQLDQTFAMPYVQCVFQGFDDQAKTALCDELRNMIRLFPVIKDLASEDDFLSAQMHANIRRIRQECIDAINLAIAAIMSGTSPFQVAGTKQTLEWLHRELSKHIVIVYSSHPGPDNFERILAELGEHAGMVEAVESGYVIKDFKGDHAFYINPIPDTDTVEVNKVGDTMGLHRRVMSLTDAIFTCVSLVKTEEMRRIEWESRPVPRPPECIGVGPDGTWTGTADQNCYSSGTSSWR